MRRRLERAQLLSATLVGQMKLASVSVTNYRSIRSAKKLPINDLTILIGPNNEGKSNILRALTTSLTVVASFGSQGSRLHRSRIQGLPRVREELYDWARDFPIDLQVDKPDGESKFVLEFELLPDEVEDFRKEVKSNLNGRLPIEVTLGRRDPGFRVVKRGPGGTALSKKADAIGQFVAGRISVEHIPAVRTAQEAERVVRQIVQRELLTVDVRDQLEDALDEIKRKQAPVLRALSEDLQETLSEFLDDVTDVDVRLSHADLAESFRRSVEVVVDDGTPTELRHKGDGVQSLAALSLLRHAWQRSSGGRQLVLAIEEPESHLHPRAIQRLRLVLQELSEKHQVIMTTHCPLFVDRYNVRSNVLVSDNQARPSSDVAEIRAILGVRASDNLTNAELVLLVEGDEDKLTIGAILAHESSRLSGALEQGVLAIESMGGASNLSYELDRARDAICIPHVLLDDDTAGRDAADKARAAGQLADADLNLTTCAGKANAELEDLLNPQCYEAVLGTTFGSTVTTRSSKFRTNRKWSDRLEAVVRDAGKRWDDRAKMRIKRSVAEAAAADPGNALNPHHRGVIVALVASLEEKLAATAAD
jgi:putative AbiEii toxin of type IV toxin-antitoxin system